LSDNVLDNLFMCVTDYTLDREYCNRTELVSGKGSPGRRAPTGKTDMRFYNIHVP
jgi:hypothetical protein